MEQFKIGTRVRVNYVYPKGATSIDISTDQVRGSEGEVTGHTDNFVEVKCINSEYDGWWGSWLFLPEELDVLEEAHPLQNEFTKS